MTEAEWADHTDIHVMLDFLGDRAGSRKLRLYLVGCAVGSRDRPVPTELQEAISTAERFADDAADAGELQIMHFATLLFVCAHALEENGDLWIEDEQTRGEAGVAQVATVHPLSAATLGGMPPWNYTRDHAREIGPNLLRCVFGNPFRPIACDPAWRTEAVVALAAGIYAERAFDRLPVLADALDDAGCANADVLAHCRGAGPHARGCWVVDLLLGKT